MDNQTTAPSQQATSVTPPKSPNGKLKRAIIFILIFAATAYLIGGLIWVAEDKLSQQKACTQEAKQCPDGSFVSRTGPNCEFSACPVSKPPLTPNQSTNPNADWTSYTSSEGNFSIRYPTNYKVNIDEVAYVDGVKNPAKNTVQIVSDKDFFINISFKNKTSNKSLIDLIEQEDLNLNQSNKKSFLLDNIDSLIFENGSDGAYGPVTYLFSLNQNKFYIFYIESHTGFEEIKAYVNQILQTFKFTEQECSDKKVYKSLEEALKSSNQAAVCYIDLSNKNLDKLPEVIFGFSNLESLSLNFNRLTTLPLNLKLLKKLKTLDLTGNSLTQGDVEELRSVLPTTNIIFLGTMNLPQ